MSKPHSDLSLLKFNYRKTKKEIIEEELFDLCTWFPITPNFRKHKINSYKLYGKNLFYGVKRKDLRKILLNKLIFNKQSYSGLFYNSIYYKHTTDVKTIWFDILS